MSEGAHRDEHGEELALLEQTAREILGDVAGADVAKAWQVLSSAELSLLAVPEPLGGGWLGAAAAVTRVSGQLAAEVPYADAALVAAPLLAAAGLEVPGGVVVAAFADDATVTVEATGRRLRAALARVPFGASAERVVFVARGDDGDVVVSLDPAHAQVSAGRNIAGEPRDQLRVDAVVPSDVVAPAPSGAGDELIRRGALARALAMSGAAEAALAASVRYATERVQFGRPIAKQQAVQHALAETAAEVEAMRAAADAAVDICAEDGFLTSRALVAVATAKAQAGASAEVVARLAHQVHGAIGTTREHPLHRLTLRLWSWRDDFGSERHWQQELGRLVLDSDPWEVITQ
jgi:acyl-CoA dehydrogenase